jgi:malate dehydrogenase (oxaloacetate-decarboxylating)(NADP+)
MIRREDSLEYHAADRPGKIELRPTTPCLTPREMRLAYLPGASFPSEAIVRDPSAVFRYTSRGNLVGVVTNGTAVPGLGMVGPSAAKPMQEGIAVLMKRLADIDVFDLEIDTADPDRFVETVRMLEPTFGGINLKDVRAPEGLYIYDRLNEALRIPVFHENLYSSAVVAAAALLNALDLVEKRIGEIRLVICGAGTLGIGCGRLLLAMGLSAENLLVYDHRGLLHPDRDDLNEYQRAFARADPARRLEEGVRGADVFLGASAGGVLGQEMVRSMARFPVVFALAFPEPEIGYDAARASRRDVIVATAFDQHPNAVLDLLSFPYIFRGALDVQATRITQGMLIAAARALADLAREDVVEEVERAYGNERFSFGPEYLLPKPIDPRILIRESAAVAEQAVAEGVARRPLEREAYQESLTVRLGAGRETMRALILRARQEKVRVVFSEGSHPTVLRACAILVDEGIAPDEVFDVVVCSESKAVGMVQVVVECFGQDRYVVLRKGLKNYMPRRPRAPLVEEATSITTAGSQALVLDPLDWPLLEGRRVLLVDDVIATGGTARAACRLLERAGARVTATATVLLKGPEPDLPRLVVLARPLL